MDRLAQSFKWIMPRPLKATRDSNDWVDPIGAVRPAADRPAYRGRGYARRGRAHRLRAFCTIAETVEIQVQNDHLARLAQVRKPILAVAELIWNAVDADADRVDVLLHGDALGELTARALRRTRRATLRRKQREGGDGPDHSEHREDARLPRAHRSRPEPSNTLAQRES